MKNKKNLTNLIRGGLQRSNFSETSESLFLHQVLYTKLLRRQKKALKKKKKDLCILDLETLL